jgi:hypothetical protein
MFNKQRVLACTAAGTMFFPAHGYAQWVSASIEEFSPVQASGGWYHGYYDGQGGEPYTPADFDQLPLWNDGDPAYWNIQEGPGGFWTSISRTTVHPNGTITGGGRQPVEHWAVRRWVSTVEGDCVARVSTIDANGGGGNGVVRHVFLDGVEVDTQVIDNGGAGGTPAKISLALSVGSVIDVAIDPRDSDDHFDGTESSVIVSRCYADVDGDGGLDLFDFLAFVNAFNGGSAFADCDTGTGVGALDLFDFLCFVNEFNAGC